MIIYSNFHDSYSDIFLIKHLRKHKQFWDYKFFFDDLSKRDYLVLAKNILNNRAKVIFVQFEGQSRSWRYVRPSSLASFNFSFCKGENNIYWNMFFDELARDPNYDPRFESKITSDLDHQVCFVSSNFDKIKNLQQNHPNFYKELMIYGEYHNPIENKLDLVPGRAKNSLFITSRYMQSLCIENNNEEGYVQGSALWSLRCLTPPILKAQPALKNFIKQQFYVDFNDYLKMTRQQRLSAITKVQERLLAGESYLTNLTKDYICFFSEAFSGNEEVDINKIIIESQSFRSKFITV